MADMMRVEIGIHRYPPPINDRRTLTGKPLQVVRMSASPTQLLLEAPSSQQQVGWEVVLFLSVAAGEEALGTFHSKNCHGFLKSVKVWHQENPYCHIMKLKCAYE